MRNTTPETIEAIRTPWHLQTAEQRKLAQAFTARERERTREWCANLGVAPVVIDGNPR